MGGRHHDGHVDALTSSYDLDQLRGAGGVVDYVVGAQPGPGVYVFAATRDPGQAHYLELYKLGEGPLYSFYTPFHLCHLEVPFSVVRAVDFGDAAIAPLGPPVVEVVATAKTDLKRGQTLDGIGGYTLYGQCENAGVVQRDRLLPIGLADGGMLRRDIDRDEVLTLDAVELPADRLSDRLYAEQRTLLPSLVRA
jgi:predicted homoserine dehydrogenase-like protein